MTDKPLSLEYYIKLGFNKEEAESLLRTSNYQRPEDLKTDMEKAEEGRKYEEKMRGLNWDKKEGRITEEEYQAKAKEDS